MGICRWCTVLIYVAPAGKTRGYFKVSFVGVRYLI